MEEVIKIDDETIKIVTNSSKERVIPVSKLIADKACLEASLSTFDSRALDQKNEIIAKFDAQILEIKTRLQDNLAKTNDLIQKAIDAGITIS